MAVPDNTYSRVVAWLKIILPLVALAILSTIFLISKPTDPAQSVPYADVDIDEISREQRLGAPTYTGVTSDGAAIMVMAESARPDPADRSAVDGEALSARIEMENGLSYDIHADTGRIEPGGNTATLTGQVEMVSSNGYRVTTDRLSAALNRTEVRTDARITATGPLGQLDAGGMVLTAGETEDDYVLVFNDGVKLVYRPR